MWSTPVLHDGGSCGLAPARLRCVSDYGRCPFTLFGRFLTKCKKSNLYVLEGCPRFRESKTSNEMLFKKLKRPLIVYQTLVLLARNTRKKFLVLCLIKISHVFLWTGRTYTLTIVNGAGDRKSQPSVEVCDSFFDLTFSFCEQSNMSPCCEFLVVACFIFLSIDREKIFQLLVLGDWGTQKNYSSTTFFSVVNE